MRVFLPVNAFISTSSPARCISESVSEESNAVTAWYRVFAFYFSQFSQYFWYR